MTLSLGTSQYKCSILLVLQNGQLYNNLNWGYMENLRGNIGVEADLILTNTNRSFIYIEKITASILNEILRQGNIKAIFTKSTVPINISSEVKLPLIITLPVEAEISEGILAVVEVDLRGYFVYDTEAMRLVYWQELNFSQLYNRLICDFNTVETYLDLKPISRINVIFARNINDLFSLTGQKSTFAYRDQIMGLIYKTGMYRPDIHEYTHVLLYKLGEPPFIFLEGMATLISDLLFSKNNNRKSFNLLASMFLKKYPSYSLEDLFTVNYTSEHYHINMYYISASFICYLIQCYGLDLVKMCYKRISRINDLARNLEVFKSIIGKSLEVVENEWLITLEDEKR
jgi:hypothetical protein